MGEWGQALLNGSEDNMRNFTAKTSKTVKHKWSTPIRKEAEVKSQGDAE